MYKKDVSYEKFLLVVLYRIYAKAITRIRKNKLIFESLFGYRPVSCEYGSYWDWTTLLIKSNLHFYIKPKAHVLDMGTGPYGVLSNYIAIHYPDIKITGADHCRELIDFAGQSLQLKNIKYIHSNLFESLNEMYDIIIFNAPYISSEQGVNLKIFENQLCERRWSGGVDGTITVKRFLKESKAYMHSNSIVLLGVNHFYVSRQCIIGVISENGYIIKAEHKNRITKSGLYVLQKDLK